MEGRMRFSSYQTISANLLLKLCGSWIYKDKIVRGHGAESLYSSWYITQYNHRDTKEIVDRQTLHPSLIIL